MKSIENEENSGSADNQTEIEMTAKTNLIEEAGNGTKTSEDEKRT